VGVGIIDRVKLNGINSVLYLTGYIVDCNMGPLGSLTKTAAGKGVTVEFQPPTICTSNREHERPACSVTHSHVMEAVWNPTLGMAHIIV
jgi:hypothetical protein